MINAKTVRKIIIYAALASFYYNLNHRVAAQKLPEKTYVLLYDSDKNNAGIHSIQTPQTETILMFESLASATNFAHQLAAQNFPTPEVESIATQEVTSFCRTAGYVCKFIARKTEIKPPQENIELENTTFFSNPPRTKDKGTKISFYKIRSRIYFDKQKYRLALADLNRVIELDPRDVYAYASRGAAYGAQEKYELAIASCLKAISIDSQDPFAYEVLAFIYFHQSEYLTAIDYFGQAKKRYLERHNPQAAAGIQDWIDRAGFYQKIES